MPSDPLQMEALACLALAEEVAQHALDDFLVLPSQRHKIALAAARRAAEDARRALRAVRRQPAGAPPRSPSAT